MPDFDSLETLLYEEQDFVAYITLNRPAAKNAMNFKMVEELTHIFTQLQGHYALRAIVLSGAEGTFCAGGDLKEMRENPVPDDQNAANLDRMLRACANASQIVIARVEGAALGGGLGLVCVSDVAIAANNTRFGFPEVRLGIAPAYISPYVLQRAGLARARELMLTGRRFDGEAAYEYGFLHQVCPPAELDHCVEVELDEIRQAAPQAIAAIKNLITEVQDKPLDETVAFRAQLLNTLRTSPEGQEGISAFVEKRPPNWVVGDVQYD